MSVMAATFSQNRSSCEGSATSMDGSPARITEVSGFIFLRAAFHKCLWTSLVVTMCLV